MYRIIILLVFVAQLGFAQDFYVTGATVHIGNGEVIENAIIVVKEGKILEVTEASKVKIDNNFGPTVKADGKHIYPGLIAPDSRIGLVEVDALRQTKDFREVGEFNPNIRSLIAYNADSDVGQTILSNGITYAQVVPQGGKISGSSSVVKLQAWNWEDAAVRADDGIHVWWPARFKRGGWWASPGKITENEDYQKTIDKIEAFLKEAQAYNQSNPEKTNLKFEALKGVFDGTNNFYVHTQGAKEMIGAISLADRLEIKNLVIVGGSEAMEISDLLKEKNIPIILRSVHRLPSKRQSDVDEPFKLPAELQKAGIKFCLSYKAAWEQRSLMFLAGTAAAYGLTKEEALASITKNTAEILGLNNIGTLEKGKDATFIVSVGDILDMRTSIVTSAYINGEAVDLSDKQKLLYEKFMTKYKSEGKL